MEEIDSKETWQIWVAVLPTNLSFPLIQPSRTGIPTRGRVSLLLWFPFRPLLISTYTIMYCTLPIHYSTSPLLSFSKRLHQTNQKKTPFNPFLRQEHLHIFTSRWTITFLIFTYLPSSTFPNTPIFFWVKKKPPLEKGNKVRDKQKKRGNSLIIYPLQTPPPPPCHCSVSHRLHRHRCPLALALEFGSISRNQP